MTITGEKVYILNGSVRDYYENEIHKISKKYYGYGNTFINPAEEQVKFKTLKVDDYAGFKKDKDVSLEELLNICTPVFTNMEENIVSVQIDVKEALVNEFNRGVNYERVRWNNKIRNRIAKLEKYIERWRADTEKPEEQRNKSIMRLTAEIGTLEYLLIAEKIGIIEEDEI